MRKSNAASLFAGLAAAVAAGGALAQDAEGKPVPQGTGFQPAVTELMRDIVWFDNFLHILAIAITIFVCVLLLICIVRYNKRANPTPARFTHHALLEVVWTGVPIVILVVVGAFSVPILFKQLYVPQADITIKAIGNQWNWDYEYPDHEIDFNATMIRDRADLADAGYAEDEYLLATDEVVVLPVNKNIHVLVTGSDVIHAWTVPAFGVKVDAIPGRMNELWLKAEQTGTYFGQCSELCGLEHSYMPITVKVVSEEEFNDWVNQKRADAGLDPMGAVKVAAAE